MLWGFHDGALYKCSAFTFPFTSLTLTVAERSDGEKINFGVLWRTNLWHEALEHFVTVVGGIVHQDLVPDEKQPHAFASQLVHIQHGTADKGSETRDTRQDLEHALHTWLNWSACQRIIVGDPVCVQQVTIIVTLNLDCVQSLRNVHSRLVCWSCRVELSYEWFKIDNKHYKF